MTEYISYNRKKGASIYKAYWQQLKTNPNTIVSYEISTARQPRFFKAIVKLKHLDREFKAVYPRAKLVQYKKENLLKIMLITNTTKTI